MTARIPLPQPPRADEIAAQVAQALREDGADHDLTAALIDEQATGRARIITREPMVLCGAAWAEACFRQLDQRVRLSWNGPDGTDFAASGCLVELEGPLRALLSGERCALNFLQTLSATATVSRHYARLASGSRTRILDTRKTLPGLRLAQKYAVAVGGCHNHRIGLHDAVLIKENHIMAAGSIGAAIAAARRLAPGRMVEVEVESLDELQQGLQAGADRAMLDEFDDASLRQAVALAEGRIELEISGSVDEQRLPALLDLGVDYISIGALTKHVRAIDLSMRVQTRTEPNR
ncbi:MAG: carboxylating nicotinate-nucleotide diphosphorylase [Lysobacterales bacterium]